MVNSLKLSLPSAWYPLCRAIDLKKGRVIAVPINGIRYALWRSESGKVSALAATCVHVGADLARGKVQGESLQCPLHHWCYDTQGRCVEIPGRESIPPRARQVSLPCKELYGLVFGFLGGLHAPELPRFENEREAVWSRAAVVDVAAPYTTLVANSYDAQHFAAVHDRELLEAPRITRDSADHIGIHYRARVVGQRLNDRILRSLGIDQVTVTIHCWGGSLLHVYNERTANTILVSLLPLDEEHTRIFILTALKERARGIAGLLQPLQLLIARWLAVAFLRPDMGVLEGVTLRPQLLLPGTDDALVAWLRYWKELPRGEKVTPEARSHAGVRLTNAEDSTTAVADRTGARIKLEERQQAELTSPDA